MTSRFFVPSFVRSVQLAAAFVATAVTLVAVDVSRAVDFSVGAKEVIYTSGQRKGKGLSTWPDGNLGVVPLGNGLYDFYGANGSKPVKTTGTLANPGTSKKSVKITDLPRGEFNYVSGGPVFKDPTSGARFMIYHAEKHGRSAKDFYSVLGLAVSTDLAGRQFRDLGTIIEPNLQTGQAEVGGGSFAMFDNHLHVYYRDTFAAGGTSELAVARAPITDLVNNALAGQQTAFTKYYNGGWSQPGRGGLSTALEVGNPSNAWQAISYNDYLDQLVMVSSQWTTSQPDLYMTTSSDGIHWAPRQAVVTDVGEQFYPTIIGTGADPTHSGQQFHLYYTDSKKGAWSRWSDAQLVRRSITLDPFTTPSTPAAGAGELPGGSTPPPVGWSTLADYRSDFQIGAPADGWQYAWNPTGSVTNPASFRPLTWSHVAQAYNTTGAATPTTTKKKHNDDYLSLTATGGHPGQPKYFSIAGYTIQADDGSGLYRIADSSISKADGVTSKKEDGLRVLIYRNNSLLGTQSVSTNGALANFDRSLGQLNVGDTIWVMLDALKNQSYDSFTSFDF
jgi:hypothetical protein